RVEGIPTGCTPTSKKLPELHSYPDILHDFGFFATDPLDQQLRWWVDKLTAVNPDLIIVDHSPMVLLANQVCKIKCISSGSGFTVPPASSPMRPMRFWSMPDLNDMTVRENQLLTTVNEALHRHGALPLMAFADFLSTDRQWLLTFSELDHYGPRNNENYLGNFPQADFGAAPKWGSGRGKKLFVYLAGTTVPVEFVVAVQKLDANLCLFAPDLLAGEIEKLGGLNFYHANAPVSLIKAAVQCDAALTHGGLNSISTILLCGKPVVAHVDNLERYMVGRRLELLGAGLAVPKAESKLLYDKLRAVLHDRSFSRNAQRFRERYRDHTADMQLERMMTDISALLSEPTIG
ncbi:MAG: UDP:flavonoid glycosyltransferase YjiC (YdhE family), partial [Gammaproteobacteria bacterium]